MASPAGEITALLKLLDDESPTVRAAVKTRLAAMGPELKDLLVRHAPEEVVPLIPQAVRLQGECLRERFQTEWEDWLRRPASVAKLEDGLTLLSRHLHGDAPSADGETRISRLLNRLAADLLREDPTPDFRDLAVFLFASGRFRGNEEDYYAAANSDLEVVLSEGLGNPILLACVMMLVGARTGVEVGGCNFPAHFLARYDDEDEGVLYLIDCFNGGRILTAEDLIHHQPLSFPEVETVVRTPANPEIIVSRVLRNLDHAFDRAGQVKEQRLMRQLWQSMADFGG